jgi:DNA invertase Pin-like site-specific DNA recombinase
MIDRGPAAFGYSRISRLKAGDSGLGPEAQQIAITKYFDYRLSDKGILWGGIFGDVEEAVSGSVPFACREAGGKLCAELRRGDHIIFSSLDRAWRNHLNTVEMLTKWAKGGINVHFIAEGIEFSEDNPFGEAMLLVLSVFAQLERKMIARRTRLALAAKKERGELTGNSVHDILYRTTHKGKRRVPDHHNRRVLSYAMWLHEQERLSCRDLWSRLNIERLFTSKGKRFNKNFLCESYFAKCREVGIVPEKFPDALRPDLSKRRKRSS